MSKCPALSQPHGSHIERVSRPPAKRLPEGLPPSSPSTFYDCPERPIQTFSDGKISEASKRFADDPHAFPDHDHEVEGYQDRLTIHRSSEQERHSTAVAAADPRSKNKARRRSQSPLEILRSRTRIWQASVRRKRTSTKSSTPRVQVFTRSSICDGMFARDEIQKLCRDPLYSLIKPSYQTKSPDPPFKVVVPTSQALTKSLVLNDCPEILASSPFLGFHLLCKRLDTASFDRSADATDPYIKVPSSIIQYIEKKLSRDNGSDWFNWPTSAKWNSGESQWPIFAALEEVASDSDREDGILKVRRADLEDLAWSVAAQWPDVTSDWDFHYDEEFGWI